MKIWRDILNYVKNKMFFGCVCFIGTIVLFLIMKSDMPITDAGFCIVTVTVVGSSYRRYKLHKDLLESYIAFENYLDKMRHELMGSRSDAIISECFNVEIFCLPEISRQYYYRVFCGFWEAYSVLGSENSSDVADVIGCLQETIVKECDLRQDICRELGGLKWIILSAIPLMPLVRAWVVANMSEMALFYNEFSGIMIKYGIWMFALLVFMFFDRLGEIKSEKYI